MKKDRPPYWADYCAHIQSQSYADRVAEFEAQGMDTSDAQGCADAEFIDQWHEAHPVTA